MWEYWVKADEIRVIKVNNQQCLRLDLLDNDSQRLGRHRRSREPFACSSMEQYGMTEQEVRKRATELFGSLEKAMQAMEITEAENKAATESALPAALEIQAGVSGVVFLNLKTDFPTCSQ